MIRYLEALATTILAMAMAVALPLALHALLAP